MVLSCILLRLLILYNVPSRTGCNILPETIIEIAKAAKNVIAVKEASGNISQVAKLAALAKIAEPTIGNLDIYSGNDDQIVPILSLGGKGVISVLSNIAPTQTHDIVELYLNGEVEKSTNLQLELIELIDGIFCEVNPIPVKAAMNLMGKNVGSLRMPLTELEDNNKEKLAQIMKRAGLI